MGANTPKTKIETIEFAPVPNMKAYGGDIAPPFYKHGTVFGAWARLLSRYSD